MTQIQNPITRADVVAAARLWLETPYVHQASCLGVGCDCLGLVRGVWRALYGKEPEQMPNYSADWAEAKGEETLRDAAARSMQAVSVDDVQPGDILLFRWRSHLPAKHVAILTTSQRFIHACEGLPVSEVSFSNWWRRRLAYAFKFPGVVDFIKD